MPFVLSKPVRNLFTLELSAPAGLDDDKVGILLSAFEDICLSSSSLRANNHHKADWVLRWVVETVPDEAEMTARLSLAAAMASMPSAPGAIHVEPIPGDINWLEHCYRQFPPFEVAGFFVYGSHYTGRPPEGLIPLQIDAATAFGSGEHGTTAGCLELLKDLHDRDVKPGNCLDMGTGSGILAIAAWKLWQCPVLAVDIDPESVRVTQTHANANDVSMTNDALRACAGDGFQTPAVRNGSPFELVIANILAGPLVAMAGDLQDCAGKDAAVILSGMLNEQAEDVLAAYGRCTLVRRIARGEWTSLLLKKL